MSGIVPKPSLYRFGPFELDTDRGTLAKNGAAVKLQDLPFRLLQMLVEAQGGIVSREDLRRHLWTENTFVEFDNSLGVAIRKIREALHDNADAPLYVETIPRRGYRFLAKVTIPATAAIAVPAPVPVPAALFPNRNRVLKVAAMIAMLVGGAIYVLRSASRPTAHAADSATLGTPARVRRSVAVLGFRNISGRAEDNWLSPALTEMLNTELAADAALRMVSGEDVARAKRELPLTDQESLAKATLERLRTNPGADMVVLGSYTALSGGANRRLRLDIRLQDTGRGETIVEQAFTGSEQDIFELATQAGGLLRESLGMSAVSPEASSQLLAALPSNQQAVRFYTEGRAKLWGFDAVGARDLLTKAVAADPNYPLAHSALSEAWSGSGYSAKARAEAERALALSEHLPAEDRLVIEGQYRVILQDRPKAIEIYRKLFALFPDSLDYGLRLADQQRWVSPDDAQHTLDALRHLRAPTGDDPRIDLLEARVWMNKDLARSTAAAKRGLEKGTALGSHVLVARAYGILCQSAVATGSTAESIQNCENATHSYGAAGDRNSQARTLSDFAGLYFELGEIERAKAIFIEANKVFHEVGDQEAIGTATGNLGAISLQQGNLTEAKKYFDDSMSPTQAVGDKDGVALLLVNLASLYRYQGNLEAALTTYEQAKATANEIDDKNALGYVLAGTGDVLMDRGDLAGARKSYEEALELRRKAGEKQFAAEAEIALAQLSIEEGHPADAEAVLRKCKAQFSQEQQSDDELTASAMLTQALLAEGKRADASNEIAASAPLAAKNQNLFVRLQFDLAGARMKLASDHPESSRQPVEQILRQARSHGFVGVAFDAQLVRADMERKTGNSIAAHADRIALEKAARAQGFGLIARQAMAVPKT